MLICDNCGRKKSISYSQKSGTKYFKKTCVSCATRQIKAFPWVYPMKKLNDFF